MRRTNPDLQPYFLIPVKASTEASFRRWNQVLITMLGILVAGLLLAAFVPQAGSSSSAASKVPTSARGKTGTAALQGVQVQNLTPATANELGISTKAPGVVVTSVDPSSAAAADLQSGDVIQEVNRKPVRNVAEYNRALAGAGKRSILLLVNRAGSTRYIVISPQ